METKLLAELGIFSHTSEIIAIVGPLAVTIVSLVVYAWHKMEKSIEKVEEVLDKHIDKNDRIHDDVFDRLRDIEEKFQETCTKYNERTQLIETKLYRLLGEHQYMTQLRNPHGEDRRVGTSIQDQDPIDPRGH